MSAFEKFRDEMAAIADRRADALAKIHGYRSEVVELRTLAITIRAAELPVENPTPETIVGGTWLPIEQADKAITDIQDFPEVGMTIKTSDRYWVRDEDGRVYEAAWSEGKYGRDFWWDFEAESPVDPVEFMPHPLDLRFSAAATEGK